MADEPLSDSDCPGGPAVEMSVQPDRAGSRVARCRCGVWFATLMDEPTFPPHTIRIDGTVRFEVERG